VRSGAHKINERSEVSVAGLGEGEGKMGLQLESLCGIEKLNGDDHVHMSDLMNSTQCIDKQEHDVP